MEARILMWIQEVLRQDWLNPILIFYTELGDNGLIWVGIAVFLLFFKNTRKIGVLALISMAVTFFVVNVGVKNIMYRTRPFHAIKELIPLVPHPRGYSFPSGHTANAFASCYIYFRTMKKFKLVPLIFAVLMGISRMYVGVHYLTDVLAGALVAILIAEMVYRIEPQIKLRKTS